jgi:hypothetical protein
LLCNFYKALVAVPVIFGLLLHLKA